MRTVFTEAQIFQHHEMLEQYHSELVEARDKFLDDECVCLKLSSMASGADQYLKQMQWCLNQAEAILDNEDQLSNSDEVDSGCPLENSVLENQTRQLQQTGIYLTGAQKLWCEYLEVVCEGADDQIRFFAKESIALLTCSGLTLLAILGLSAVGVGGVALLGGFAIGAEAVPLAPFFVGAAMVPVAAYMGSELERVNKHPSVDLSQVDNGCPTTDQLRDLAKRALGVWKKPFNLDLDLGRFFIRAAMAKETDRCETLLEPLMNQWMEKSAKYTALVQPRPLFGEDKIFLSNLEVFRKTIIDDYAKNYSRDLARLTDALQGVGINCEGETILFIAALLKSKFWLPNGYVLGLQNYEGHVQPVLFNKKEHDVWELLSGDMKAWVEAPIYDPAKLLDGYLKGTGGGSPVKNEEMLIVGADPDAVKENAKRKNCDEQNFNTNSLLVLEGGEGRYCDGPSEIPAHAFFMYQPMHRVEKEDSKTEASSEAAESTTTASAAAPSADATSSAEQISFHPATKIFGQVDATDPEVKRDDETVQVRYSKEDLELMGFVFHREAIYFKDASDQKAFEALTDPEQRKVFLNAMAERGFAKLMADPAAPLAVKFLSDPYSSTEMTNNQIVAAVKWHKQRMKFVIHYENYSLWEIQRSGSGVVGPRYSEWAKQYPYFGQATQAENSFITIVNNNPKKFIALLGEYPSPVRRVVMDWLGWLMSFCFTLEFHETSPNKGPAPSYPDLTVLDRMLKDQSVVGVSDEKPDRLQDYMNDEQRYAGFTTQIILLPAGFGMRGSIPKPVERKSQKEPTPKPVRKEEAGQVPAEMYVTSEWMIDWMMFGHDSGHAASAFAMAVPTKLIKAYVPQTVNRWTEPLAKKFLNLNKTGEYDQAFLDRYSYLGTENIDLSLEQHNTSRDGLRLVYGHGYNPQNVGWDDLVPLYGLQNDCQNLENRLVCATIAVYTEQGYDYGVLYHEHGFLLYPVEGQILKDIVRRRSTDQQWHTGLRYTIESYSFNPY